MQDFNSMFPHFIERCGDLRGLLIPITYIFMVGGAVASTVGRRSGAEYVQTFGRTIFLLVLLSFVANWGNEISTVVDSTVKNVLKSIPPRYTTNTRPPSK